MLREKFTYRNTKYNNIHDKNTKWDIVKLLICIETKTFGKKIAKQNKDLENELYERLQHVMVNLDEHQTERLLSEYKNIHNQLEIINGAKAQGVKLRAKVHWVADRERCTVFFLNLEKQNGRLTTISRLVENGKEIKLDTVILNMLKCFYSDLYSKNNK